MEIQKAWKSYNLECMVVMYTTSYSVWRCGYVAVPSNHPTMGHSYNQVDEALQIEVHGGLTFQGVMNHIPPELYWFGFDCNHYGDSLENCPLQYVVDETTTLAKQIANITSVDMANIRKQQYS